MTIELESMAVEMPEVEGHPNRVEFRGVLTVVDAASQRPPSGSGGHRVLLTRAAAEEALPSLLGMALDYAPAFDRHDQRRKVGVITSAEIVGKNLEVGGYLYAKDFPEIVDEIARWGRSPVTSLRERRRDAGMQAATAEKTEGRRLRASLTAAVGRLRNLIQGSAARSGEEEVRGTLCAEAAGGVGAGLGMSYEVANVTMADKRSRVWILTHVTFTGAAVLRRDKAAYEATWIELEA